MNSSGLLIGIAEINYAPDAGLDLVASNERGEITYLQTIDICMLSQETIEFTRSYISSKCSIKAKNLLFHATHTHSGPTADLDSPKVIEYLIEAAESVTLASKRKKFAVFFIGRTKEKRVSFNRRLKCTEGATYMCWEKLSKNYVKGPLVPIDPELITLSIEQEGKPAGVLVNFCCHPTTLKGNNWLYSADYPGYIAESINKVKGEDFIPLFFNGYFGDVPQVDDDTGFNDTYQECQRIGYMPGISALETIKNQEIFLRDNISVSGEMVPLKRITITDKQLE